MWDGGYGMGGLGALVALGFMLVFGLLVVAGIVALIVWVARSGSHAGASQPGGTRSATTEACDIARLRYARGEITKDQFEEICRTLGG